MDYISKWISRSIPVGVERELRVPYRRASACTEFLAVLFGLRWWKGSGGKPWGFMVIRREL
ncbi:MAG: hypothetical protein RMK50_07125 [Nitrososphaerota archaeon]|nr:hypothetical protein [Candidatus Bathyarchaeota archaeon]MDW8194570.1 hypothetical protein [Nitrososphaerota archaeon]